jgi:hypothetical protein
MNNFNPASSLRTVRTVRTAKNYRTFLTVLEFRTVTPPYIGGNVSISKNVVLGKSKFRTFGQGERRK